jgi:hypothetical protein
MIAKYLLAIGIHVSLNSHWQIYNTLSLNRNNRVSSFYWTRGSKLCFLIRFSYFSFYFLILVFLQTHYSLIFFAFLGCTKIRFLGPFSCFIGTPGSMLYVCPHISGTERMDFLKHDACRNLAADSLPVIFPLSAFCRRFLAQTGVGQTQIIPFLLTKIL